MMDFIHLKTSNKKTVLLLEKLLLPFLSCLLFLWGCNKPQVSTSPSWQIVESPYSVKETMDNLEKIVKSKNLKVFARINHAEGANKINMELRPTELLIFGNPKIGTLLMQSNQDIGIDLPLKFLVYQNKNNKTVIKYLAGSALASRHYITDQKKIIEKINNALDNIVTQAIKTEGSRS